MCYVMMVFAVSTLYARLRRLGRSWRLHGMYVLMVGPLYVTMLYTFVHRQVVSAGTLWCGHDVSAVIR